MGPATFDFVDMVLTFRLAIVSGLLAFMLVSACIADFANALALRLAQTIDLPIVSEFVSTFASVLV